MRQNPYCSFKSDVERRRALVSRDIRIFAVAAIAPFLPWTQIIAWLANRLA
jgi:hypothetical protein